MFCGTELCYFCTQHVHIQIHLELSKYMCMCVCVHTHVFKAPVICTHMSGRWGEVINFRSSGDLLKDLLVQGWL